MVTVMVIPYHQLTCSRNLYPYLNEYAIKRKSDIEAMMQKITRRMPLNTRACTVDQYGCRYHAIMVVEILTIREMIQKLIDEGQFLYDLLRTCTHLSDDELEGDPVMQCIYLIAKPELPGYNKVMKARTFSYEFFVLEEMMYDFERLTALTTL